MKRLFWFTLFLLAACHSGTHIPHDVLPPGRMARVTADLLTAKEAYNQKKKWFDGQGINPEASVFADYGIDSVRYYRSLDFYGRHPDLFLQVYQRTDSIIKARIDSLDRATKAKRPKRKQGNRSAPPAQRGLPGIKGGK